MHDMQSEHLGIKIETRFESRNPLIKLDVQRFTQVLANLLSNAIKFSPSKSKIVVKGSVVEE